MRILILLTVITFVGFYLVINPSLNKDYWESVRPSWDRMLNTDTYSD